MNDTKVVAIDLGATSVRVCICDLEARPLTYEVIHRIHHQPSLDGSGRLRWDWNAIEEAVVAGLETAHERYNVASIGIDTWAVDYGLLDGTGELLSAPVAYRDDRTSGYRTLVDRIGERHLYEINGLQSLPFNTIFQLDAEDPDLLEATRHILTLPELLVHSLTGSVMAETTTAGSTGLVDQETRDWSDELLDALEIRRTALPDIQKPGTPAGSWRGIPVHLVAGHDTASAVVGIPAVDATPCYLSTGTWILAGQELSSPILSESAQDEQFTNEYGPESKTRFLKNIAGFWILEECRRQWNGIPIEELMLQAATARTPDATFDATDSRFTTPEHMPTEVLEAVGLAPNTDPAITYNIIVNSLAKTSSVVIDRLQSLTGHPVRAINVVGGGVRSDRFIELLGRHAQVPVRRGAAESAALGNAMIQGIALGRWSDVTDARTALLP